MRYTAFILIYFTINLILANLTRIFECDFFKLPSNFYVYFFVTSALYFIIYNLLPGTLLYIYKYNFRISIVLQVMILLVSTFIIGLLALMVGGAGDVKIRGVELVANGKATLAYHLYNWALVILPYLITVYIMALATPASSGD